MHTPPHALLGAFGALSSPASESPLDWVALVMLGLFLGILVVATGFYFLAKRQITRMNMHSNHARPGSIARPALTCQCLYSAGRGGDEKAGRGAAGHRIAERARIAGAGAGTATGFP